MVGLWDVFVNGVLVGRVKAAWGLDESPIDPQRRDVRCCLVTRLVREEGNMKVWRMVE